MAAALFAARPGAVVGPLAGAGGWCLFLVEELLPPALDGATSAVIRGDLFDAWRSEQLCGVRIDLSCLGPAG